MDVLRFVLLAEGTSEAGLLPHLGRMCVECGAGEAVGTFPDLARLPNPPGRSVQAKVEAALALEGDVDLIFVHRDADSRDDTRARDEIASGTAHVSPAAAVPVVPIQELEAWLLVDEQAIRDVVGKPTGRAPLSLPRRIEDAARPKEILRNALVAASEARGRRLASIRRSFPDHRQTLLSRLDPSGPITGLSAWRRLQAETREAVAALDAASD